MSSKVLQELREKLTKIFDEAEQEGSFHEFPISLLKGSFENESSNAPGEAKSRPGSTVAHDPVEGTLQELGVPVTRENYLELAYPTGLPEWNQELENELPPQLRDPDWRKKTNR